MRMVLINGLLLCLVFMWTSAATGPETGSDVYGNERHVGIQLRRKACRNLGGRCVKRKRDCPKRLPLTQLGRPYCSRKRRCCYPDDTDIGGVLPVRCGIETTAEASKRIINGITVKPDRKYSWMVGLKETTTPYPISKYFCGGSIINDQHILTAAHCFYDNEKCELLSLENIYVGIGNNKQSETTTTAGGTTRLIKADVISIHHKYNCTTFRNDIAIIKLVEPISDLINSGDIHPICFPIDDSKDYAGENGIISGWGSIRGYNPPVSPATAPPQELQNDLREALFLPVLPNDDCEPKTPLGFLTPDMICTLTEGDFNNIGKSFCQGDSGGPLTIKQNDQHGQIGIVSAIAGCAAEDHPGVYTRVTNYLFWIGFHAGPYYMLPETTTK